MAPPRAPKAKRRRDPTHKRQRILQAAHAIVRAEGVQGTTTSAIAEAAGVSQAIIFHHFGSKQGLLAAVATEYGHGVARAIFAHAVPGVRPELRPMIAGVFEYVRENGNLHDFLVLGHDRADHSSAFMTSRNVVIGALAQAFTMYEAAGWIDVDDPEVAAVLMFGLVESALTECFCRDEPIAPDGYIDACVQCIERALQMVDDG